MTFTRPRPYQSGFSTLEMLLAMFVLLLALTAVISVSFGNQSMVLDSQTNAEALNIAQGLLEKAQADARKDFNLVNPVPETETADKFKYRVDVVQKDNLTKLVTAYIEFPEDSGRRGKTQLSAIVTNFNNAVGGDTCSSVLLPDVESWKSINTADNILAKFTPDDFNDLVGVDDVYPVTDVDVYNGILYVTVNNATVTYAPPSAPNPAAPTFFTFDVSDPGNIDAVSHGFADNDPGNAAGLNAVAVADDPASGGLYAYTASETGSQLQVFDVSVSPPVVVAGLEVDGAAGNSIFYKNGYIYLGLKGSSGGPEFYIIDVHDPLHPSAVGSFNLSNNDINAIYVRGRYAYLAATNSKNLVVLNIGNAAEPEPVGDFNDGGGNHGKSLFLLGDVMYLGRTLGGTELSVIDESRPATSITGAITENTDIDKSVDGIIVRGSNGAATGLERSGLAFLLTKRTFQVFDASDINASSTAETVIDLPNPGDNNVYEAVMDCEANTFYIGSNDSDKKGYLTAIGIE